MRFVVAEAAASYPPHPPHYVLLLATDAQGIEGTWGTDVLWQVFAFLSPLRYAYEVSAFDSRV